LKVFEQRFKARVQVDLYDSVEALLAKLQSGNSGYDVVVPSDYAVQILQRQRLLSPSTRLKSQTWNETSTRSSSAERSTRGISIRFPTLGHTGIGYRKDRVGQLTDGWQVLWEEQYRGKIVMLDDMRENFGAALKLSGFSINSRDPAATGNREGPVGQTEARCYRLTTAQTFKNCWFLAMPGWCRAGMDRS
jgi:spermidine/putrescine-binding protein